MNSRNQWAWTGSSGFFLQLDSSQKTTDIHNSTGSRSTRILGANLPTILTKAARKRVGDLERRSWSYETATSPKAYCRPRYSGSGGKPCEREALLSACALTESGSSRRRRPLEVFAVLEIIDRNISTLIA